MTTVVTAPLDSQRRREGEDQVPLRFSLQSDHNGSMITSREEKGGVGDDVHCGRVTPSQVPQPTLRSQLENMSR